MGDPVVGSVLGGKYLVEGILGQGGMGVVVAARHIELDQKVAIKCLLAHAQAVPEIVERFTREARAAAKIHGEHVARVIDVGRFEDGTPFMVMEHLKGRDLADELASKGALPVIDAIRYILETCEALVQAHALRIVHRDLKPANLFLAEQPGHRAIVKVLDFGISKVIDPSGSALTKTASIMGTPYYMSPEQLLSSKSVDERSDIWALGVILYELLVGRPPFVAETAPEIVAQVLQNQPEPITQFRQDVPQGILDAVARCMRSKVNDRFANVADLAQALVAFAAPEDRGSAVAIARVLGVQAAPTPVGDAHHAAGHAPTISANFTGGAPAPAGTAHNLAISASQSGTAARKPFGAIAAAAGGVAALAAIAITGVVVLRRPPPAAAVATPSIENVAPPTPSAVPPAALAVGLAPVESVEHPAAAPPPASASATAAAAPAAVAAPAAAAHAATVKHAAAPAAAAPAAPHPAAAAPAAAPAAAAPAVAPASNPLDMHIK